MQPSSPPAEERFTSRLHPSGARILPNVEGRSASRQPVFEQVEVQVEDRAEWIAAEVRDLSPSGMGLIASRAVDVGARLTVRSGSCSVVGRVRYCRPTTDGIRVGLMLA
jgi:hypothetical protein